MAESDGDVNVTNNLLDFGQECFQLSEIITANLGDGIYEDVCNIIVCRHQAAEKTEEAVISIDIVLFRAD